MCKSSRLTPFHLPWIVFFCFCIKKEKKKSLDGNVLSEIYIRVRFFNCTFGTLGFALDFLNRGVVIYSLGLFSLHFFYVVLYFVLKITSVFFLGNVCVCVCVCVRGL